MKQFLETMIYYQVSIYAETITKLFNQAEPKEDEAENLEESIQINDISFELATDFVNQPFKLSNSYLLKALTLVRIIKLGSFTKHVLILT